MMADRERFKLMEDSEWYKWATSARSIKDDYVRLVVTERAKARERELRLRSDEEGCGAVICAAVPPTA